MGDDELHGELRVVSLHDEPVFEALSYTWGSRVEPASIMLQTGVAGSEINLPLTLNLARALRRLRHTYCCLWVDAICINQEDLTERRQQVAYMGRIYSAASRVLVWLGDSDVKPTTGSGEDAEPQMRLQALQDAIARTVPSWWTRSWVLQEFGVACHEPSLCFGPCQESLDTVGDLLVLAERETHLDSNAIFDSVAKVSASLKEQARATRLMESFTLYNRVRQMQKQGEVNIIDLLLATERTSASDPRDKLYALLGLLPTSLSQKILPDYAKPLAEVFAEATIVLFRGNGDFRAWSVCRDRSYRPPKDLPTWALDFDETDTVLAKLHVQEAKGEALSKLFSGSKRWTSDTTYGQGLTLSYSPRKLLTLSGFHLDNVRSAASMDLPSGEIAWVDFDEAQITLCARAFKDLSRTNPYHVVSSSPIVRETQPQKISTETQRSETTLWDTVRKRYSQSTATELLKYIFLLWRVHLREVWPTTVITESDEYEQLKEWLCYFGDSHYTYTIFVTVAGFVGLARTKVVAGDTIALLLGSNAPVVLSENNRGFSFKGFAFVNGIMAGELSNPKNGVHLKRRAFVLH